MNTKWLTLDDVGSILPFTQRPKRLMAALPMRISNFIYINFRFACNALFSLPPSFLFLTLIFSVANAHRIWVESKIESADIGQAHGYIFGQGNNRFQRVLCHHHKRRIHRRPFMDHHRYGTNIFVQVTIETGTIGQVVCTRPLVYYVRRSSEHDIL